MAKKRELRDPIHGFIDRSKIEVKIIDTDVFQRLRGIKQLAMAYLAYPGAMHTRFDHSLGVMHLAGQLGDHLLGDNDEKKLVRIAALLHDIGHGPFSHVSEAILDRYYDKEKIQNQEKIHEQITCKIIETNEELSHFLIESDRKEIIGLISGNYGEPIVQNVISGPLDADKQDYLLRDSYFCGVKYGVFDSDRLIGTLESYPDVEGAALACSRDGLFAIEQFVIAKYHMASQVYRHKIRLISDAMIIRGLELGLVVDELDWLINLYAYDGTEDFISNYTQWDDQRLTTQLLHHSPGTKSGDIFTCLSKRALFKRVFSKPLLSEFSGTHRDFLSRIDKEKEFKKGLEAHVADTISTIYGDKIESSQVILSVYKIKSVMETSLSSEGPIIILTDGGPRKFEDESTLFKSIVERENEILLDVYAPLELDETEKDKKMKEINAQIHQIIIDDVQRELNSRRKDKKEEE